jgi:hypothetical protein
MPNRIEAVSNYSAKSSDIFFFDNNIWMYLYCPLGNYNKKKQAAYSKFFSYIISRNLHIYTNSLVLSEFANRYLKLDFEIEKKNNIGIYNSFKKDYMPSNHGKQTINTVKTHLQQIYKLCQKASDEFNSINMLEVFSLFTEIGFNDSYYVHQAIKKNWIIVSDDSDFTINRLPDKNLLILTAT